jgi:hypothetical protein
MVQQSELFFAEQTGLAPFVFGGGKGFVETG